jgi:riboflavin synthase
MSEAGSKSARYLMAGCSCPSLPLETCIRWRRAVQVPLELARYFAYKGSITVNGVSLTVNLVTDHAQGCDVDINLIPHTWQVTALHLLKVGSPVNVEIDLMARYIERMLSLTKGDS